MGAYALVAILLLFASGCETRTVTAHVDGSAEADAEPAAPNAAPLRRLTNAEYVNALTDLFPGHTVDVPWLPKDLIIGGFDNAAEAQTPTDVRIARSESSALAFAQAATVDTESLQRLTGCKEFGTAVQIDSCIDGFLAGFGRRVFRRTLDSEERHRFSTAMAAHAASDGFHSAVAFGVQALLQSPQFLYRINDASDPSASAIRPEELASRMSFFLWQSIPDDALLAAAESGVLATDDGLRAEASRMLDDVKARRVYWSFFRQWLNLDRVLLDEHAVRTEAVDAIWSRASTGSLLDESRRFVENLMLPGGRLSDLLSSNDAWLDAESARIYGVPWVSANGADALRFALPANQRAES